MGTVVKIAEFPVNSVVTVVSVAATLTNTTLGSTMSGSNSVTVLNTPLRSVVLRVGSVVAAANIPTGTSVTSLDLYPVVTLR